MKPDIFIKTIYQSLYSSDLYRDVALRRQGTALVYLLLILSLHWIPEIMKVQGEVSERLAEAAPKYIAQIPLITISKGKASIREQSPFYIYELDNKTVFAVIDTSGQYSSLDNSSALALLTGTKLITKNSVTGSNVFDLSGVDKITVDHNLIYEWLEEFKSLFAVLLYPFALFFSFASHVLQALICAFMGRLFARMNGVELGFQTLVRLAVTAMTPAVLLQTAHTLLGADFQFSGPITFVLSLGYLYYAVQSVASKPSGGVDKTA